MQVYSVGFQSVFLKKAVLNQELQQDISKYVKCKTFIVSGNRGMHSSVLARFLT